MDISFIDYDFLQFRLPKVLLITVLVAKVRYALGLTNLDYYGYLQQVNFYFLLGLFSKRILDLLRQKFYLHGKRNPFSPFKHGDRNYYGFCKKCLELDLQTQCNHSDKERSYEVTTTGKFCK